MLNREDLLKERLEGNESEIEPVISASPVLADHALVYMVRPLKDNWIMPFAVFASHGAASGDDLYRLLISALIYLETKGEIVIAVVNDRAATNRKVWTLAGVGISRACSVKNTIAHPMTKKEIFLLQDVPHIFKCIRNQMYNNDIVHVCFFLILTWFLKMYLELILIFKF